MTKIQIIKDGVVIGDREITETQEESLPYTAQKAGSDKDGFSYLLDRFEDVYKGYESSFLNDFNTEYFNKAMRLPIEKRRQIMANIDAEVAALPQEPEQP